MRNSLKAVSIFNEHSALTPPYTVINFIFKFYELSEPTVKCWSQAVLKYAL
jgi:hypothetical protein